MKDMDFILKRTHLDKEIPKLTMDLVFRKVFSDEKFKWYLAYIIDYCTDLGVDYIMENITYKNNFISSDDITKKTGEADIIVEVEDKVINLEMNQSLSRSLIRKNKHYVTSLSANKTKKIFNKYMDTKFIIQINISNGPRIKNTNELLYEIEFMDKNLKIPDMYNNEIIYDINLEYLKNELYNKRKLDEKEKNLLLFIETDKDKLLSLFGGDNNMKDVILSLNDIQTDDDFIITYDNELLKEISYKESIEEKVNDYELILRDKDEEYKNAIKEKDEEFKNAIKEKDEEFKNAIKEKESEYKNIIDKKEEEYKSVLDNKDKEIERLKKLLEEKE